MERKHTSKKSSNITRVGRYSLSRTIGKGNFAIVKLGKHDVTKSKVAVKIIDKTSIDSENLRKVYREIQILKQLVHPHIIRLYQVMENDSKLFIITEYASGGEVFEYLRKNNRMSEREARKVFRQIVAAVAYCHTLNIAHRDIKAENLLFSETLDIKLVDFGFSNYAPEETLLQTWCGSPPYAAPELFLGEKYSGQKADVWSLGVVLYILVCGGFPFPSSSIERLRNAVLDGHVSIPFYVSSECADLIRKMLIVNPRQRISIRSLVQHRWFMAADWNDNWSELLTKSLEAEQGHFSDNTINYACIAYMQQRGYSADRVIESIQSKLFDDEYATYHLLHEKLRRKAKGENNNEGAISPTNFLTSAGTNNNGGRRGSRGSITTGRVDIEPALDTPLISTIDLAKLGMSSSSEEDTQSSESENGGSTSSSPSASLQTYLAQRRHTALGVPAALGLTGVGGPSSSGTVGFLTQQQQTPVPYPLNCNLGEMSNLANYAYLNLLRPPNMLTPRMINARSNSMACTATTPYDFLAETGALLQPCQDVFPATELLAAAALAQQQAAAAFLAANAFGELAANSAENPLSSASFNQTEEAGARYLRSRSGASKRHTIHNSPAAAAPKPFSAAAAPTSSTAVVAAAQSTRSHRNEPYHHAASAPRRVTDSSHMLTSDTLRHLERLYQNALQRSESPVESMRSLQQEFQQLRATTEMMQQQQPPAPSAFVAANSLNCCDIWRSSPRSSPPTQMLGMIAEHEPYDAPLDRFQQRQGQQQPPQPSNLVAAARFNRQNLTQQQQQSAQMMDVVDATRDAALKLNGNVAAAPVINIFNDAGNSTNL